MKGLVTRWLTPRYFPPHCGRSVMLQLGAIAEPGVTIEFTLASSSCQGEAGVAAQSVGAPPATFLQGCEPA